MSADMAAVCFILGIAYTLAFPENLNPTQYERAVEVCEGNGGLRLVELDHFMGGGNLDATCNNGAEFEDLWGRGEEG